MKILGSEPVKYSPPLSGKFTEHLFCDEVLRSKKDNILFGRASDTILTESYGRRKFVRFFSLPLYTKGRHKTTIKLSSVQNLTVQFSSGLSNQIC